VLVVALLFGCDGSKPDVTPPDAPMLPSDDGACALARTSCNPLTQAGCAGGDKCTWIMRDGDSGLEGHVGCAPAGHAAPGDACSYSSEGYDTCMRGLVCDAPRAGTGTCKRICDQQGSEPACDGDHACVESPNLFRCAGTRPAVAGVCDPACDPLADNDFDGSGSAFARSGSGCGSDSTVGCYGYPSFGAPPRTAWACVPEHNPGERLHHRTACSVATGCADENESGATEILRSSCSQGYLPLMYEATGATTVICVALCKPTNCFAGNCGTDDVDRLGEAPHRCSNADRMGTFDTTAPGEHCQYLWIREVDVDGAFLRSPTSDAVGVCVDHSKYRYDSNSDGIPDTALPPCAALSDGFGSGSDRADPLTYFGAADLGCVDSTRAVPGRVPRGLQIN